MCGLEGRCVVGAVAGDGHDFAEFLQRFDEAFFIHRARSGDDFETAHPSEDLIVGEGGEIRACDYVVIAVAAIVPKARLTAYFLGGPGGVAGDDFYVDSGLDYLAHSIRDVFSDGVRNRRES